MSHPNVSVIIPTHNRPQLVALAVQSALNQTYENLEVLVVDDASDEPVALPDHPRLRVIRLDEGVGGAGARNIGTQSARGRWITYLDDDDRLLPDMVKVSLTAIDSAAVEPPVGVISGIQKVDQHGAALTTRIPPAQRSKGRHFFLEPLEPGRSYNTKQTLVIEREVVLKIGGWDKSFRSRVHSEFFLRLNPECTLIGLPTVTYHLLSHTGVRVSVNPKLRQESFHRLVQKHEDTFKAHPKMFAEFVYKHALTSYKMEQWQAALVSSLWAFRLHPAHVTRLALGAALSSLSGRFKLSSPAASKAS